LRDFTYVADTVEGFLKAATRSAALGRTVNLGTSTEISIGDLVEKIGEILGRELRISEEVNRTRVPGSEVERLFSDNSLARELLGWRPEISLDEGLRRTLAWISENRDHFRTGTYEI
jgi:dTDP-glucose 4,6-dehydratase